MANLPHYLKISITWLRLNTEDGIDLKERKAKEELLFLPGNDDPEIGKAFEIMQEYGHASNFTNRQL